jgi:uncharacterized membrane-anchored protein YhcB (DUF1043 family)
MKLKLTSRLQSNLVNELLRCPADENTGKTAMSCDANSLQTGDKNFCLRTANSCASNLNGCLEKAEKKVEETRQLQAKHVDIYKGQMDLFKEGLKQEFATIGIAMEREARALDGMFQMGTTYNMPLDLDLQTMVSEKTLMKGVDESLGIEDPKVYLAKIQGNIKKLKKQVEKQNKEVEKKFKDELKKYEKNYKKEMKHWEKVANECKQRIIEHNQIIKQQNEQNAEAYAKQQEEIQNSCNRFKDFRRDPCPASGNEVGGLSEDMAALGNYLGEATPIIDDVVASCQNVESYDIGGGSDANSEKYKISLDEFCKEDGPGGDSINCQIYDQNKKKYRDYMLGNNSNDVAICSELPVPLKKGNETYCKKVQDGSIIEIIVTAEASCSDIQTTDGVTIANATYSDLEGQGSHQRDIRSTTGCAASREIASENGIQARFESAKEGAMEELEGYRRNQMSERMGQVQIAACDGMATGEVDMTGDPIQQMIQQMSTGGAAGVAY